MKNSFLKRFVEQWITQDAILYESTQKSIENESRRKWCGGKEREKDRNENNHNLEVTKTMMDKTLQQQSCNIDTHYWAIHGRENVQSQCCQTQGEK